MLSVIDNVWWFRRRIVSGKIYNVYNLCSLIFAVIHVHTELVVSLFIRCTMRCEIWAHPAELPW